MGPGIFLFIFLLGGTIFVAAEIVKLRERSAQHQADVAEGNRQLAEAFSPFQTAPPGGGRYVWIQLHTGSPDPDGRSHVAGNNQRRRVTIEREADGRMKSVTLLRWAKVPNRETYSHLSMWTARQGGQVLSWGSLTVPKSVRPGDTFEIAAGDLEGTEI